MTKKAITIDDAVAAGSRLPTAVRTEIGALPAVASKASLDTVPPIYREYISSFPDVVYSVIDGQRILPELTIGCFGDSLTNSAGTDWPALLAARTGMTTVNRGISGQGSADIILRQGGVQPRVTVTGGVIPAATTAVAVTDVDPATGWRTGGTGSFGFAGTLAGIPGSLAHDLVANVWSFTRAAAGTETPVTPGIPFIPAASSRNPTAHLILWVGRNNLDTLPVTRDLIGLAIAKGMETQVKRFIIVGVTNGTTEGEASANHQAIVKHNNLLRARYGRFFLDIRRGLIDRGLTLAGASATPSDTADIADDRIPGSLMTDTLHMNSFGYRAVSELIAEKVLELGWVSQLVDVTAPGTPTVLVSDSFNRTNTTPGTLGTADAALGGTATAWGATSQIQVLDNQVGATALSSHRLAPIEVGTRYHRAHARISGAFDSGGVILQYTDGSNYIACYVDSNGKFQADQFVGGTKTILGGSNNGAVVLGNKVSARSTNTNRIKLYVNDLEVADLANNSGLTGTKAGIRSAFNSLTWRLDEFVVTDI